MTSEIIHLPTQERSSSKIADDSGSETWNQHEDPPILVNADFFEQKPFRTPEQMQEFRRFSILYMQRAEEHLAHLERLLESRGIVCECEGQNASPQCLIHVKDNLPDD